MIKAADKSISAGVASRILVFASLSKNCIGNSPESRSVVMKEGRLASVPVPRSRRTAP